MAAGGALTSLGFRNLTGTYFQALEDNLEKSWAMNVGWLNQSDQPTETYKWLGQAPQLREWVGGRLLKSLEKHTYALTNRIFESTLRIDVDDIRREKINQIMMRVADMARRSATHWELLVSSLINTNPTAHDGLSFFNTGHVLGSSGTINNAVVAAQVPALNVTTATNPTQDEMAKIILGMIQHGYGYLDDQGEPMNQDANSFCLMVPVNMWAAAKGAISSERLTAGESNILLSNNDFSIELKQNPRLTSNTNCYLFRTDVAAKPFILQEETGIDVKLIGAGSEHEFKNREHLFGVEVRREAGVGIFQYAIRGTLS
jgi:phage major head subunit gpT-like protein